MKWLRKIIEWAFFKYVVDFHLDNLEEPEPQLNMSEGYDESDVLDALCYSLGGAIDLLSPKFDNEIDKAMYERKFNTLH